MHQYILFFILFYCSISWNRCKSDHWVSKELTFLPKHRSFMINLHILSPLEIDVCQSQQNPCQNGGLCVSECPDSRCVCSDCFTGENCETGKFLTGIILRRYELFHLPKFDFIFMSLNVIWNKALLWSKTLSFPHSAVSWEQERYQYSKMFHWEPEGRYRCTKAMVMVPFWFSMEHLWTVIAPFYFSTDDTLISFQYQGPYL